jgi:hypothetical protein
MKQKKAHARSREVRISAGLSRRHFLPALVGTLGGWLGSRQRQRPVSVTPTPVQARGNLALLRQQVAARLASPDRLTEVTHYDGCGRLVASTQGVPCTEGPTAHPPPAYTEDSTPY